MAIEWNRVTWYSKAVAVLVFLATFAVAFWLGAAWGRAQATATATLVVPAGSHR